MTDTPSDQGEPGALTPEAVYETAVMAARLTADQVVVAACRYIAAEVQATWPSATRLLCEPTDQDHSGSLVLCAVQSDEDADLWRADYAWMGSPDESATTADIVGSDVLGGPLSWLDDGNRWAWMVAAEDYDKHSGSVYLRVDLLARFTLPPSS